jgi:hypothetical protein
VQCTRAGCGPAGQEGLSGAVEAGGLEQAAHLRAWSILRSFHGELSSTLCPFRSKPVALLSVYCLHAVHGSIASIYLLSCLGTRALHIECKISL